MFFKEQHQTYVDYSKINKNQYDHRTLLRLYQSSPPMNCIVEPTNGVGGIYLGNIDAAADYTNLRKNNIKAVLTVAARTGIKYNEDIIPYHEIIVCDDHPSQNLLKFFDQMYDFIDKYRKITNVFIHCYAGISRSSTTVIMYLMRKYNWTYEKSFFHCRQKRKVTNPNPGFVKQLLNFERQLIDKRAQAQSQSSQNKQEKTFLNKIENQQQKDNQGIKSYLDNTDYKNRMTLYREQQQQNQQQNLKIQRSSSGFEQRQQQQNQQLHMYHQRKQQNEDYFLKGSAIQQQQSDKSLHKSVNNSKISKENGYQSPNFSYFRQPSPNNNSNSNLNMSQNLPGRKTMYQEPSYDRKRFQQQQQNQHQSPYQFQYQHQQSKSPLQQSQQIYQRPSYSQVPFNKHQLKPEQQSLLYKKYQQLDSNNINNGYLNKSKNISNIYTTSTGATYGGARSPQGQTFLNNNFNANNQTKGIQKPNTSNGTFTQYQQQQYGYYNNRAGENGQTKNQDSKSQQNLRSQTPVGYQPATSNYGANLFSQKSPGYNKYY